MVEENAGESKKGFDQVEESIESTISERVAPEQILRDARSTLDHQIRTIEDVDTKAARTLQLNIVIISVILASIPLAADSQVISDPVRLYNRYTGVGITLLLVSTGLAAVTYTASTVKSGLSDSDLHRVVAAGYYDDVLIEETIEGYADWIEYNDYATVKKRTIDYDNDTPTGVRDHALRPSGHRCSVRKRPTLVNCILVYRMYHPNNVERTSQTGANPLYRNRPWQRTRFLFAFVEAKLK